MPKAWKDYITDLAAQVNGDAGKLFESAAAVMVDEKPEQKTVMVTYRDGSMLSIVIVPPNAELVANTIPALLDSLKKTRRH